MNVMRRLDGRAKARGWRRSLLAATLPLALALGACSSDEPPQPTTVATQDTSNQPYPNLATVPDKPPPVSPEEIRANTAAGLSADRANAKYANTLTADATAVPAAQPPGPPPPEPEVKVVSETDTTEERITESGVVEETEDDTVTEQVTQNGRTTTVTETEDTEVSEQETGGGEIATAEVDEADADEKLSRENDQNNDGSDSNTVVDDTDTDVESQSEPGTVPGTVPDAAPAPSVVTSSTTSGTTTTPGGVTEVTSLTEVCKVASDWERKAYGCDNLSSQPTQPTKTSQPAPAQSAPAPAPAPAPAQPAPSYTAPTPAPAPQPAQTVQSQPIPAPAPVPVQPQQTQQVQSNIPAAPAYSSTPPAPAGSPTAPAPGQQAPLAISPPVGGSAQTVPPAVSPTPTYTPPATPVQPQPAASQPAPAPSNAELCRVAQPWEREIYGCDKPTGTQQSTAPAYTAPSPAPATTQGTIGSGKVDLVGVIFFANGSAALDGRDAQVLQQIAQLHKQYGGVIRVVGNASSRTSSMDPANHEVANFEVSMERAGAVAAMLARYGVAPGAIITEARSDSTPVYHEFMPTGEAGNRRAEIYLEY